MRVAIYCRVSRIDQHPENQLHELRLYAQARGWSIFKEYEDRMSGAKESRPAFNQMLDDARRRRFDMVLCWRLDRFSRSLRNLLFTIDELVGYGVSFSSLNENIDTHSVTGRFTLSILGALAEMERSRISERVKLGLDRAKRDGVKLGRKRPKQATDEAIEALNALSLRAAAQKLGVSKSFIHNYRASRKSAEGPGAKLLFCLKLRASPSVFDSL